MGVSIRRFPGTPGTLTELTTLFNRDALLRATIDTACRAAQPKRRPTRGVFALIALALALLLSSPAFADTVFSEDFSGGAGQFTGFATGCNWHTPGLNAAMISYFGNDQYAEVRKGGCGSPIFSAAIVSSSFSLAGHENAELSFRHVLDQSGTIGQGTVSVSTNGGSTWTTVFSTGGNDAGSTKTVDLSNYDGQANVKIRFSYSYFGGILAAAWGVDDVTVEADAIADDDTADDDTADDDTADDDTTDDDTVDDDTADDDDADDDSGGDTVDVQISTLGSYSPDPVSVRVGDSVRWNNNDLLRKHSATQGNTGEPDPDWDTGLIDSDGQALITFHAAGTFVYHCKQHGGENGMQVIVQP